MSNACVHRFENGCSENSTQKLATKYSTEEKINMLFAGLHVGRSVLGKTLPSVLSTVWPRAKCKPQTQALSFCLFFVDIGFLLVLLKHEKFPEFHIPVKPF